MATLKDEFMQVMIYDDLSGYKTVHSIIDFIPQHKFDDFEKSGVDLDRLLAAASLCNDPKMVQDCLSAGAKMTPEVEHAAFLGGEFALYKLLVPAGLDVNREFGHPGGPLTTAVQDANVHLMEYLLENGADPELPACAGDTALILAVRDGLGRNVLKLLKEYGADIIYPDLARKAILLENDAALAFLLEHGFDIHIKTGYSSNFGSDKCTLLHLAATWSKPSAARILLHHNANLDAVDFENKTAAAKALKQDNSEMVTLLN